MQDVQADGFDPLEANVGSRVTAVQGTTLRLACYVIGMPVPRVLWRKQDGNIATPENKVVTLENVRPEDSGSYWCTATNVMGSDQKMTRLTVRGSKLYNIQLNPSNSNCQRKLKSLRVIGFSSYRGFEQKYQKHLIKVVLWLYMFIVRFLAM